jgi:hypothetical protein
MRKKRLEEKQKKIEQQQQKIATPSPPKAKKPEKIKKPPPPPKPNLLKLHCSACGAIGHMKTNRSCPLYGKEVPPEESGGGDQPAADDPVDVVKTVGELCKKVGDKFAELSEKFLSRSVFS